MVAQPLLWWHATFDTRRANLRPLMFHCSSTQSVDSVFIVCRLCFYSLQTLLLQSVDSFIWSVDSFYMVRRLYSWQSIVHRICIVSLIVRRLVSIQSQSIDWSFSPWTADLQSVDSTSIVRRLCFYSPQTLLLQSVDSAQSVDSFMVCILFYMVCRLFYMDHRLQSVDSVLQSVDSAFIVRRLCLQSVDSFMVRGLFYMVCRLFYCLQSLIATLLWGKLYVTVTNSYIS